MFKLILIVGWTLFFAGLLLALVLPTHVLPHFGLPLIVLGILLGVNSFCYGIVYVVRQRVHRPKSQ